MWCLSVAALQDHLRLRPFQCAHTWMLWRLSKQVVGLVIMGLHIIMRAYRGYEVDLLSQMIIQVFPFPVQGLRECLQNSNPDCVLHIGTAGSWIITATKKYFGDVDGQNRVIWACVAGSLREMLG